MHRRAEATLDAYPDETWLFADNLGYAIIGVDDLSGRVVYSVSRVLVVLMGQDMSPFEAREFFDFNIKGSFVGERTPIWCEDDYLNSVL